MIRLLFALTLTVSLLLPTTSQAERPYTAKIYSEFVDTIETPEGIYTGPVEDRGSCVIVSPSHVLTNNHVVAGYLFHQQLGQPVNMTIHFPDGSSQAGHVVGVDSIVDLALVRFDKPLPEGLHRIGIAKTFQPTQFVMGGYEEGTKYAEVTANTYVHVGPNFFQFPGRAIDGQSGSPIIDQDGKLCGLLWGSDHPTEEFGYGVKVDAIRAFLKNTDILHQKGN